MQRDRASDRSRATCGPRKRPSANDITDMAFIERFCDLQLKVEVGKRFHQHVQRSKHFQIMNQLVCGPRCDIWPRLARLLIVCRPCRSPRNSSHPSRRFRSITKSRLRLIRASRLSARDVVKRGAYHRTESTALDSKTVKMTSFYHARSPARCQKKRVETGRSDIVTI